MYQINDTILYGAHGACRFEGLISRQFNGTQNEYYVLKPVSGDNSTIYVPAKNEKLVSQMRPVLSEEELLGLISQIPGEESLWIENDQERKEKYHSILISGDRIGLVRIIKGLYSHRKEQQAKGRKLHSADERIFKEAEKILYDEFALVLHMEPEEVLPFLQDRLEHAGADT